jgi:hypothetical protein
VSDMLVANPRDFKNRKAILVLKFMRCNADHNITIMSQKLIIFTTYVRFQSRNLIPSC